MALRNRPQSHLLDAKVSQGPGSLSGFDDVPFLEQ